MASTNATTFRVCDKKPEKHHYYDRPNKEPQSEQIKWIQGYEENNCTEILQMSNLPETICISKNGFVHTVVDAYNRHHNLVIRPDDVWGTIMTQFSFYINKHAEEFRNKFVNFEGKKTLEVMIPGTLRSAPYDLFVKLMTKKIDENLVDPEVKQWILPNFSTTTDNDLVTIGVVFMATMKKYFDYRCCLMCGIPSVTMEGTIQDWENLYGRLEKLKEYKLDKWYGMLKPILKQFVNAKKGKPDLSFWNKVAHYEGGGSGPTYISGWITAFCAFDKDGNWQDLKRGSILPTQWLKIDTNDIPTGIVEVDVTISDNGGAEYKSVMLAGHIATEIKNGGDTVQPTLGWMIALKGEDKGQGGNMVDENDEEESADDEDSSQEEDQEENATENERELR